MIGIRVLAYLFLAMALSTSAQQDPNVDVLSKEANAAYEAKNWERAAKLYEELSKEMTTPPPRVWLRLGAAKRSLGRYEEALAAFEKAGQSGGGLFGEYGKAAVYVALNQPEKAFASLDKAVQQGYADPDALTSDPGLSVLRNDPRFARIIEQAKKNQRPCAYTPENRQFDFWLGEWNVSTTQGAVPSGNSKIELILEDCVVQENWKSLNSPYAGNSYNIYNASLKRWEQYWVDNVGGNIFFYGGLKDGVMDYWTDDLPQRPMAQSSSVTSSFSSSGLTPCASSARVPGMVESRGRSNTILHTYGKVRTNDASGFLALLSRADYCVIFKSYTAPHSKWVKPWSANR